MPVKIRNMSKEEFDVFYQWSIEHNTSELMEEKREALLSLIRG